METQGFYRYNETLEYSPASVISPEYVLSDIGHEDLIYPIDGWYWFDSEEDAKWFFRIKE